MKHIPLLLLVVHSFAIQASAQARTLLERMIHLRQGGVPEWANFPAETDGYEWSTTFPATANETTYTLRLRQQDVKQAWHVTLNTTLLGTLHVDENDMVHYLRVPANALRTGDNTLRVRQQNDIPDDIRIGEITLIEAPPEAAISDAEIHLTVTDADSGIPLPARVTVLNASGALQMVGAQTREQLAVRPGIVYTGDGQATFGLPEGRYTIYAGRGFEYGIDSVKIDIRRGEKATYRLAIRREVPTPGYVSSDTHVHTWTYSGHGDATVAERMITLAGEGIELPVATDHNQFVDFSVVADSLGLQSYFTSVVGNEVTTPVGHVNIFPAAIDATVPTHSVPDWSTLFDGIFATSGIRVAILNHGRDLHSGFRPFDAQHHVSIAGANTNGWVFEANAMEVINSSAQQSDMMQLFTDWFGLLNRGYSVTPIGSSDSHDVGRHFVGQGRTYVRVDDADVGNIDIDAAVESIVSGRVLVSLGLLADIVVNDRYGPGEMAPASDSLSIFVRVLGPGWTRAETIDLYANGLLVSSARITDGRQAGLKWAGTWTLPRFAQDVYLVAIARGPAVKSLYWPIAKPYKPDGPVWIPQVLGATGAVRIDSDGDGKWTSAYDHARRLIAIAEPNLSTLVQVLSPFDEAVATQVAALLAETGRLPDGPALDMLLQPASPATKSGFKAFRDAQRMVNSSK